MAVATSDSGPENDNNSENSDAHDSPKATSSLLKQSIGGLKAKKNNQKQASHVLMRQKASCQNSVDI